MADTKSISVPGLRPMPDGYIELVRLARERALAYKLASDQSTFEGPRELSGVDGWGDEAVVMLRNSSASRVFRLARDVATVLRCDQPFNLYQTPHRRQLNASVLYDARPFGVRLVGPIVNLVSDAALRCILGHEFGHYLTLGPHAVPRPPSLNSGKFVRRPRTVRDYQHAAELTADRFGLLAAQSLEAAVELEIACDTFASPTALGARPLDYIADCCAAVEQRAVATIVEDGYHPTHTFRLYATWLFWRSDVYRRLTGDGPGDLTLAEVEATLNDACERGRPGHSRRVAALLDRLGMDGHKIVSTPAARGPRPTVATELRASLALTAAAAGEAAEAAAAMASVAGEAASSAASIAGEVATVLAGRARASLERLVKDRDRKGGDGPDRGGGGAPLADVTAAPNERRASSSAARSLASTGAPRPASSERPSRRASSAASSAGASSGDAAFSQRAPESLSRHAPVSTQQSERAALSTRFGDVAS